jgi:hypothetical protein
MDLRLRRRHLPLGTDSQDLLLDPEAPPPPRPPPATLEDLPPPGTPLGGESLDQLLDEAIEAPVLPAPPAEEH